MLNQGDPQKEKQLVWNYTTGFYSENSEDETTNLKRVERNFYKQRREKHSKPYLRERPIKQFELLMLKLGGKDILEKTTGKSLGGEVVTVYDWQDP